MATGFGGSDHLISRAYTLATQNGHKVLLVGNHGAGYSEVATDSDGHLQVDVLSGGGGGNATVDIAGSVTLNSLVEIVASPTLNAAIGGNVTVHYGTGTFPVSAVSLPLPSGASTSALQSTGNTALAAIQTAVQIMDDWDATDRCKVNPIASQAGVQGGSGTVSANTQRVVLATDVGLPAGTSNIGDVDIASTPETEAKFRKGSIAFGSLTGTYADIVDLPATTAMKGYSVLIGNSLNQECLLSFDDGSTDGILLAPFEPMAIDLKAHGLKLTDAIQVKHNGTAPTVGSIRVTVIGVDA